MLKHITSIWNRHNRNNINNAIDVLNQHGVSIQDLVAEGQLTPAEYAQLVSIVNGNISKGNVTVDDIDINQGKLEQRHMSDALLQMMAGNTPINTVPEDGTVTSQKLTDGAANRDKRTNFGEQGLVTGTAPAIVNFDENMIMYSNEGESHFIMHRGVSYPIPDDTIVHLTPRNGMSGIWFNPENGLISEIRHTGEYAQLEETHVLLGYLYLNSSNTLNAEMFGNYSYIGDNTKSDSNAFIISNDKIDFNFTTNELVFPPTTHSYVFSNGRRFQIQNRTTISFDNFMDDPMFKIMFDLKTGSIYFSTQNEKTSNQDAILGAVIVSTKTVNFNGEFTVDGQENAIAGMGEVKYIGSDAADIDVNNRKLTFPNPTALIYVNGREYRLDESQKVIDLPAPVNVYLIKFNVATGEIRATTSSTPIQNEYLLMVIKLTDPIQITFNGSYTINGAPVDGGSLVDYNLEDMIWSWWIYPLATRFIGMRDRTYIGYTDSKGYSGAASLDNETGERAKIRLKNDRIDDHNAAAVDVMDDGRVIAAYSTGHNSDGNIHVRISTNIESVEEFGPATTISTDGRITYAHLFKGGGKWWLFFRGPEGDECSYTSSEDGFEWSEVTTLIDYDQVCYPKIQYTTDPNILRFVISTNPMSGEAHLRLGFFNMTTGEFKKEDGTVLGTENVAKDSIPIIVERISGMTQRLLDVAITDVDETIVGYSVFSQVPNASDIDYRVVHWSEDNRNIDILTDGGKPFYLGSNYVGGIAFGYDKNELYLSREDNGVWHIEKWATADQVNWSFSERLHTTQPGYVALRPVLEKDGDKILWHEGVYNEDSYSDYYTDVKYRKIRELY